MRARTNPHEGSDFESFLKEEGIYEEVTARAFLRVAIEQLLAEMKRRKPNEAELARRMDTSRSQIADVWRRQWIAKDKVLGKPDNG